jgi:hypothetical protein
MRRFKFCVAVTALLFVAACGRNEAPRAEWRAQAERACMQSGQVRLSQSIRRRAPINPGGSCGADYPLEVSGFDRADIRMSRAAPMTCPMVAATDRWLAEVVQPSAIAHFGSPVAEIETYGTYNCRRVMNRRSGPLSEHAFANAIDISGFRLADGRRVRVGRATAPALPSPWRFLEERSLGVSMAQGGLDLVTIGPGIDGAAPPEINFGSNDSRAFWRQVRNGACAKFSTVLGPGSEDGAHEDHLHLDLARHGRGGNRRVCR